MAKRKSNIIFDYFRVNGVSLRYGACFSSKNTRGTVILLSGRTEFIEKYTETINELAAKGFDVFSLDWRGQGLSTRQLPKRQKGFIKDYNEYISDLAYFIQNIVKPRAVKPFIILAHSMGGHISLRFLHDYPNIIDRAVLSSPMVDIITFPLPQKLIRAIAGFALKMGRETDYAIGHSDYPYTNIRFEGNTLTSDPKRFRDESELISKNPDLALGGVTYSWLDATFSSIDTLKTPEYAANIFCPVLILSAGNDKIVSKSAQKKLCAAMPNCKLQTVPGARHEILKERDEIRALFWSAFEQFVD